MRQVHHRGGTPEQYQNTGTRSVMSPALYVYLLHFIVEQEVFWYPQNLKILVLFCCFYKHYIFQTELLSIINLVILDQCVSCLNYTY